MQGQLDRQRRLRRGEEPELLGHGRRRQPAARTSTRSRSGRSSDGQARLNSLEGGEFDVIHTSGSLQIERDPRAGRQRRAEQRRVRRVRRGRLHHAELEPAAVRQPDGAPDPRVRHRPGDGQRDPGRQASRRSRRVRSRPATSATSRTPATPSTTRAGGRRSSSRSTSRRPAGRSRSRTRTRATRRPPRPRSCSSSCWATSASTMNLQPIADQSALIDAAIGGEFQAVSWRNHPGADPDTQYVWWYNTDRTRPNPVNFGRFNDPEINALARRGPHDGRRGASAREIYEDLNRRFAEQLWNIWAVVHDLVDRQSAERARRPRPGAARRQRAVPGPRDRSPGLGYVGRAVDERRDSGVTGQEHRERATRARHSATDPAARRGARRRDVLRRPSSSSSCPVTRSTTHRSVRRPRSSATDLARSSASTSRCPAVRRSGSATSSRGDLGNYYRGPHGDRPGLRQRLERLRRVAAADDLHADPHAGDRDPARDLLPRTEPRASSTRRRTRARSRSSRSRTSCSRSSSRTGSA